MRCPGVLHKPGKLVPTCLWRGTDCSPREILLCYLIGLSREMVFVSHGITTWDIAFLIPPWPSLYLTGASSIRHSVRLRLKIRLSPPFVIARPSIIEAEAIFLPVSRNTTLVRRLVLRSFSVGGSFSEDGDAIRTTKTSCPCAFNCNTESRCRSAAQIPMSKRSGDPDVAYRGRLSGSLIGVVYRDRRIISCCLCDSAFSLHFLFKPFLF